MAKTSIHFEACDVLKSELEKHKEASTIPKKPNETTQKTENYLDDLVKAKI